jgi:uncharacterized repeat protein (TIGR01451 family)
MMRRMLTTAETIFIGILLLISNLPNYTGATPASEAIQVKLEAKRVVVNARGRELLQPAPQAKPGDTLEYSAEYRNVSRGTVSELVANLPIPVGTTYVENSAYPRGAEASLDGTTFAPMPLMRDSRTKDLLGTNDQPQPGSVREAVPLIEYRALRWQFPQLESRKTVTVRARAVLNTNNP